MSFFALTKLATQLFYPLSLAIALLLVTFALLVRKRTVAARRCLAVAIALLWLPSTPVLSYHVTRPLEMRYPPVRAEDAASAGAIVLLGGAIAPPRPPLEWMDLNHSADRIVHAARLWRAGKAPIVVASGGGLPTSGHPVTPADAMAELLVEWGVPRDAIVLERDSKDTYENALFSKRLLDERGIRRVLVVTSAQHMPRSLAVFRALGFDAIPAGSDYSGGGALDWTNPIAWIPDAGALRATASGLKEYLGILVYWARGRLRDPWPDAEPSAARTGQALSMRSAPV